MGHSFIAWGAGKDFENEILFRHAYMIIDGSRPQFAADLREVERSSDALVFYIDEKFMSRFTEVSDGHALKAQNHLKKLVNKFEVVRLEIFP
jgi:hypothetical protein